MLYTCSYRAEINVLICGNANIAKSCNTFFCYLWFALFLVLPSTSEMSKDTPPPPTPFALFQVKMFTQAFMEQL